MSSDAVTGAMLDSQLARKTFVETPGIKPKWVEALDNPKPQLIAKVLKSLDTGLLPGELILLAQKYPGHTLLLTNQRFIHMAAPHFWKLRGNPKSIELGQIGIAESALDSRKYGSKILINSDHFGTVAYTDAQPVADVLLRLGEIVRSAKPLSFQSTPELSIGLIALLVSQGAPEEPVETAYVCQELAKQGAELPDEVVALVVKQMSHIRKNPKKSIGKIIGDCLLHGWYKAIFCPIPPLQGAQLAKQWKSLAQKESAKDPRMANLLRECGF